MAKMSYPELDKKFEKMSRSTANKLRGTHPSVKGKKKTSKKKK